MPPKPDLILLALDDSPILHLMERALRAVSYETAIARDSAALNQILLEMSPALVLIGESFSGKNGIEISKGLLERFPTMPIILYAEKDEPGLARYVLKAGLSGYLVPPMHNDDIVAAVHDCLQRSRRMGDWVRREVKRTTASLEQRVDELETLVKLGSDITSSLELDLVLKNVVKAAVETTGADSGSLLLLDEEQNELYLRAGHNFETSSADPFRLSVENSLAGQVVTTGQPVVLSESSLRKIKTSYLVHSLIYVPLHLNERNIGVLGVDNRVNKRPFSDHEALLMSVLAEYAAIAIENARLYQVSKAERDKFLTTFSNIQDGVMILDTSDHIVFINAAMLTAFEVTHQDWEGKPVREVISHPDLNTMLNRSNENALKYHEINFDDERVFNAQYTPIPEVGSAITMQDITYLKELDRIKNDFVHTVSHDLRSPLTSVLGYTELMERVGTLSEQQVEFLHRIQNSVQHITALVNDLLDLGRIEAGFDTRREIVRLDGILQYTLDNYQPILQEKKIDLQINVADDLPALRGNPIRLRQMLDNLVGNAIKYTPNEGRVEIDIHAEDQQVILKVGDTGPGIPQAEQPHIFDKFFRASNVPSDVSGSGLGLAIVKTIVDSHQGRIWVESSLDKGSNFFVVLPSYDINTPTQPAA